MAQCPKQKFYVTDVPARLWSLASLVVALASLAVSLWSRPVYYQLDIVPSEDASGAATAGEQ